MGFYSHNISKEGIVFYTLLKCNLMLSHIFTVSRSLCLNRYSEIGFF